MRRIPRNSTRSTYSRPPPRPSPPPPSSPPARCLRSPAMSAPVSRFSQATVRRATRAGRTSSCRRRRWRCVRPAPAWPCHNLAFFPHRAAPCAPRRSQKEALEEYLDGGFNEKSVMKQAPCALPTPRTRWPAAPLPPPSRSQPHRRHRRQHLFPPPPPGSSHLRPPSPAGDQRQERDARIRRPALGRRHRQRRRLRHQDLLGRLVKQRRRRPSPPSSLHPPLCMCMSLRGYVSWRRAGAGAHHFTRRTRGRAVPGGDLKRVCGGTHHSSTRRERVRGSRACVCCVHRASVIGSHSSAHSPRCLHHRAIPPPPLC